MAIFRAKNTLLREEHGQMARAKRPACQSLALAGRHFLPGHVWHITHRCHKKEFLLKFARDRCRWLQWLFEAKNRNGAFWEWNFGGLKKFSRQKIMFEKANGLKASLLEVRVL